MIEQPSPSNPVLQLALDFVDLDRAVEVAEEALRGGVDWLEVGTPLIKSEGLNAVREFRRRFQGRVIVADLKTIDTGAAEVEMASKAGADVVIVLGVADDSTVREAVDAARRYGSRVMVDLLNVEGPVERAWRLEELGVDYVCVHVGIDQQMKGVNPLEVLSKVASRSKVPVAIAGGINSETAAKAVELGASIVIVGGAITKAERAEEAARAIKQAMLSRRPVRTELYKKYGEEELEAAFLKASTPNISDAMHRRGEMKGVKPVTQGAKMAGRAFTVRTYPGDWAKPVEAIDQAPPGSVIVIDASGSDKAVWGELATWSCAVKGIRGVVVDGAVRDVDEIRKLGFPVFARHISPTAGDPKGFGEVGVEITCGGVRVRPGDWVIGDDNGVVVVPSEVAVEVANRALDVLEKENRVREEIRRGSTLSQVLRLKKWEKIIG
ncbi:MAG: orotidine 5'-phosphate decarboxylase [Candidatus Nezhaarchaeota archaeon]|nr:orotidine 5'-phosphate decarboxylase [Candidatus Nezhaarchaeota archaeon]